MTDIADTQKHHRTSLQGEGAIESLVGVVTPWLNIEVKILVNVDLCTNTSSFCPAVK